MCPTNPHPSRAVYQMSAPSPALRRMLCRRHLSPQCHHSAFKIQSFSETAVKHHFSSPPFWLWPRGSVGLAYRRPSSMLNSLDTWSIITLMCFDRFHWSLGDNSSHSATSESSRGGGRFLLSQTQAERSCDTWHWIFMDPWATGMYSNENTSRFINLKWISQMADFIKRRREVQDWLWGHITMHLAHVICHRKPLMSWKWLDSCACRDICKSVYLHVSLRNNNLNDNVRPEYVYSHKYSIKDVRTS